MLNNKQKFDVITPIHDFHRMSKPIAGDGSEMDVDTVPGMWVKLTKDGIKGTKTGGGSTGKEGYSALCISNWKSEDGAGVYEAHDTRGGSISVVVAPGVVCRAGQFYFPDDSISSINIGDLLTINAGTTITDDTKIGKMKVTTTTGDIANAIVIGKGTDYIEYMITEATIV